MAWPAETVGEQFGLPLALGGQCRVAVPVDARERRAGDHRLGLAVAHEQQLGGAWRTPEACLPVLRRCSVTPADAYVPGPTLAPDDGRSARRRARRAGQRPRARTRASVSGRRCARCRGAVFVGCNVENASFPEGICAEAAAIGAMVAAGERRDRRGPHGRRRRRPDDAAAAAAANASASSRPRRWSTPPGPRASGRRSRWVNCSRRPSAQRT